MWPDDSGLCYGGGADAPPVKLLLVDVDRERGAVDRVAGDLLTSLASILDGLSDRSVTRQGGAGASIEGTETAKLTIFRRQHGNAGHGSERRRIDSPNRDLAVTRCAAGVFGRSRRRSRGCAR